MNREQLLDFLYILKTPFVDNIYRVTDTEPKNYPDAEPKNYLVFMAIKMKII